MYRFQRLNTSTTTLNAQLFANETILCTQANVGLYDGKEKDLSHDNGTLYLTTHRLIYVDALRPHYNSCHLDLALVRLTEYWAGFISSSPKITLTLGESLNKPVSITPISNTVNENNLPASARAWVCRICGFSNSPAAKCTLCGVARDLGTASNPPSRASTPAPASCRSATPTSAPVPGEKRIACPRCTFLNHPSMSRCEVCDSNLGNVTLPFSTQESIASPSTPAGMGFVRLSFRKGGVQAFYASLKSALVGKAWEVSGGRTNHGNTLAGESVLAKETITVGIGEVSIILPQLLWLTLRSTLTDGILKTIDLTSQGQTTEMQDALQDLNALMLKAKEMVSLAQSLNAKLPATAPDSETSTIVKSSLVKMGLQMPALTQDMVRDEEEYHAGLARELAGLLTDQSKNNRTPLLSDEAGGRGIMPIEEIWCIWNRARGICTSSYMYSYTNNAHYIDSSSLAQRFPSDLSPFANLHLAFDSTSHLRFWFDCPAHTPICRLSLCSSTDQTPFFSFGRLIGDRNRQIREPFCWSND